MGLCVVFACPRGQANALFSWVGVIMYITSESQVGPRGTRGQVGGFFKVHLLVIQNLQKPIGFS